MEQAPKTVDETSLPQRAPANPSRVGAVAWLVACAIFLALSDDRLAWFAILLPTLIGAAFPIGRWLTTTTWLNGLEVRLQAPPAAAAEHKGPLDSFVKQPIRSVCWFAFTRTRPVRDPHLRAGLRVAAVSYLVGALLSVLLVVGYVLVVVVLAVAVFGLMIWILFKYGLGVSGPETRITTDWMGNHVEKHYDEEGQYVGESRETTDFLGMPVKRHYDSEGGSAGESRPTTDLLGNPTIEHHDQEGHYVGESRPSQDLLGNPLVEHYDEGGAHTGTSRAMTDALGAPIIKHDRKEE